MSYELKIETTMPVSDVNKPLFDQLVVLCAMDSGWFNGYEKVVGYTPIYEDIKDEEGNVIGQNIVGQNEIKEPQSAKEFLTEHFLMPAMKEMFKQKTRTSLIRFKGELEKPTADMVDSLINEALVTDVTI